MADKLASLKSTTMPECLKGSKCAFNNKYFVAIAAGASVAAVIGIGVYYYYYGSDVAHPPLRNADSCRPRRRSLHRRRRTSKSGSSTNSSTSSVDLATSAPQTSTQVPTPIPSSTHAPGAPSYAAVASKDLKDQKTQEDSFNDKH